MKIKALAFILSLPKTLYVNFRMLPLHQAVKLPVFVRYNTKLISLRGKMFFTSPHLKLFMLRIGFGGSGTAEFIPNVLELNGEIYSGSSVTFGGGCQIAVGKNAKLNIGDNVHFMGECHIAARKEICIEKDTIISWNTQIMDTDMHSISNAANEIVNPDRPVYIGERSWIGSRVNILKGTETAKDVIIASGSTIRGKLEVPNSIYCGLPVKILKTDVKRV